MTRKQKSLLIVFSVHLIFWCWICTSCSQKAQEATSDVYQTHTNRSPASQASPHSTAPSSLSSVSPSTDTPQPTISTTPILTQNPETNPDSQTPTTDRTPEQDEFVRVKTYLPTVQDDLKYATVDNFTGKIIYTFDQAYLRYGTVVKLANAAQKLAEKGYGIRIWDAFRPTAAQFRLWEICPNPTYVANPNKRFSSHSRGNTVDITLYSLSDGKGVAMPTDFDDFTPRADRDYSDIEEELAERARLLENIMSECGFKPYRGEWWHFSDTDSYPVEKDFLADQVTGSSTTSSPT